MEISFDEEKTRVEERKPLIKPQIDSRQGSIVVEISSDVQSRESEDDTNGEDTSEQEDKACLIASSENTSDVETDDSSLNQDPSVHSV